LLAAGCPASLPTLVELVWLLTGGGVALELDD